MSDAYSWAIRQKVGHGGKKSVLLFMATHATFRSSIADMPSGIIADALEFSESSIRKWLAELTEEGIVEKVPQFEANGAQLPNLYRLNVQGEWVTPGKPKKEKSRSVTIPSKTINVSASSKSFEQQCLDFYLEIKPDNWVEHRSITGRMRSQLRKVKEHFGDDALDAFKNALRYAKQQDFWTNPDNTFSLANLGSNDKLIDMAEKYKMALQQQEERLFSGAMTESKAKEIIKKYPEKPVTAEMWRVLNDDFKIGLIEEGQVRHHEQLGPVLITGKDRASILCMNKDGKYREHIRHFTHEVLDNSEFVIDTPKERRLAKPVFGNGLMKRLVESQQPS